MSPGAPQEPVPRSAPGLQPGAGALYPLGASLTGTGVNFAVWSSESTALELCLFDPEGAVEIARFPFHGRENGIWHLHLAGLGEGALYGLRADGPWAPAEGLRFNRHKLLIDPWTRGLAGAFHESDEIYAWQQGDAAADLSFDSRDTAAFVPKSVVSAPLVYQGAPGPGHAPEDLVICEAHLRGLTRLHPEVPEADRGLCAGLAAPGVIRHLKALGVTAVELLPVQAIRSERFLTARGLQNYWGYNTAAFFVPEPRYTGPGGMAEFQRMVDQLHRAGLEVILDVVFNHSAESDHLGPSLSLRGLDNRIYYRLRGGGRFYANDSGTGNVLDLSQPIVLRLVMDALRYWVTAGGVDGFRFDLAPVLTRNAAGEVDPRAPFFAALLQDPVLQKVRLIAEPWDIGPGGYLAGRFPPGVAEWNDFFRDTSRRFWRGDEGLAGDLASALLGSARIYEASGRGPMASVNYITSHDGFTLADLTRYNARHNEGNGEENRDGHHANHSDNHGVEGESSDPLVLAARSLRQRNLLATLFFAQGVPMLLAGDEIGHSQGGNNNAYAQDNEVTWLNWQAADQGLCAFTARLGALRRRFPALRQKVWLHGKATGDGARDVIWRRAGGEEMTPADWQGCDFLALELREAGAGALPGCGAPPGAAAGGDVLYLIFNRGADCPLQLPPRAGGWRLILDTSQPALCEGTPPGMAPAQSVLLLHSQSGRGGQTRPA